MCIKDFDNYCKCDQCKLITQYKAAEKKLSELNDQYNKTQKAYHNYLDKIRKKLGSKADRLGFNLNSDYDQKSKDLWLKHLESDRKCQKQIYRLNSLEKKAYLLGFDREVLTN